MSEPLRILIVEDEALLAMELEMLVEDAGHEVVGWATSSEEARRIADQGGADVAFVDIHLTDGPTGTDVAEYMLKNKGALVVFLTANPKRIPDHFSGAIGVIAKPYTVAGLTNALAYIQEGVRDPPPVTALPTGFTLSPAYATQWARA